MCFEAALLALIVGLLLGGSLKKLLDLEVRGIALLLLSVLMSLLPQLPVLGVRLAALGTAAAAALAVLRYGFLIAFALWNLRYPPVAVIAAGGFLNFIATMANNGRMPVSAAALGVNPKDASAALLRQGMILNYQVAGSRTRLLPLCDIMQARGFFVYFLSLGDILIAVGIFALVLQMMKPRRLSRAAALLSGSAVPGKGRKRKKEQE